jgi:predicted RNA-binding Zn-ribbon protein involved in translation (DUF1610 family)
MLTARKYINFEDFKKADGNIDWSAYSKAQVENGDRCSQCGKSILFGGSGYQTTCEDCGVLHRSKYAVEHGSFIRCPHCRHEMNVYNCEMFDVYQEGYHEIQCNLCDKKFEIETRISYSFESPDIIEDEDEEDDESTTRTDGPGAEE